MYCAYVLMRTPQHGCRRAMVGVGPSLLPCSRQGLSFCHCFIYTRLADPLVSGAVFCFNLLSYNRSVATADMCYLVLLHGLWESKLSSSGCWQELSPPGTSLLHIRQWLTVTFLLSSKHPFYRPPYLWIPMRFPTRRLHIFSWRMTCLSKWIPRRKNFPN